MQTYWRHTAIITFGPCGVKYKPFCKRMVGISEYEVLILLKNDYFYTLGTVQCPKSASGLHHVQCCVWALDYLPSIKCVYKIDDTKTLIKIHQCRPSQEMFLKTTSSLCTSSSVEASAVDSNLMGTHGHYKCRGHWR